MKIELNLRKKEEKKHSVIYVPAADAADPIVTSVYITKVGMLKAGHRVWPLELKLTVE